MAPQGPQYAQNIREQVSGGASAISWPKKFFTFGLIVFIAVLLVYAGLAFGYGTFLKSAISGVEDELDRLSNTITAGQKENLSTLYSQVTNIRRLADEHVISSAALDAVEDVTSERVVYTNFEMTISDRVVALEGVAGSYEDLVSQLALYERSESVERFSLETSELEGNIVRFSVKLTLSEDVLLAQDILN